MKIVIVGGHLAPALAAIDNLPKDTKLLFIGRKYTFEGDKALSLEYREITKRKVPFTNVISGRLQRRLTRHTIPSLIKVPYGFIQSFFILQKFKPDVFLGFGGYLSLPLGLAAFILRIPIVIHEQTLEAGIANKILSFFAKKICISWESSRKFFPKNKTVLIGNPIRKFSLSSRPSPKGAWRNLGDSSTPFHFARNDTPIIYITGGSSGSHFINTLVEGCIKELLEKFVIIHQTGDAQEYRDFDRLNNLRDSLPSKLKARYFLIKFVEPKDVGSCLQKAHLVVSRAGINTITELIFLKKPSLLIPLRYSQNNEQIKNALFLKSLGLGEVLEQGHLSSQKFLQKVIEMVNNINKYKIKDKSNALINKNAAQKIIEVIQYATKSKKN
ncbi:MAG: UDP-N-acetylglucosamine--N-acetylmuramyl-(pentapeptide) pyrophosphoryl-undecaprenol N-acetylglucosamine transferase [Patescibacteria group bacterium]